MLDVGSRPYTTMITVESALGAYVTEALLIAQKRGLKVVVSRTALSFVADEFGVGFDGA